MDSSFTAMLAGTCLLGLASSNMPAAGQEEIRLGGRRVVGGEPADIKNHPWQVALVVGAPAGSMLCGGSIVGRRWVLTAAHCFEQATRTRDVRAKAGATDVRTDGLWVDIERIVLHHDYNAETQEHDIALVKLRAPPNGRAIPLAGPSGTLQPGEILEVTGWGATFEGPDTAGSLLKASVPYVENATCNSPDSYDGRIQTGMMCAGYRAGGIDACQGDSGGPLVWRGPDGPVLVGIVSFGEGCARNLKYGVYTRVGAYRGWIDGVIASDPD